MIELHLPLPPSANDMWRIAGRRLVKTSIYEDWIHYAGLLLNRQFHGDPLAVPYKISMQALRGNALADLDNIIKPTNDLMQKMRVVENDRLTEMVSARWVTSGEGVTVRIEAAGVE